ncbi:UNVERIFIED_CONTAM: hypothetical protein HDU68_003393 [Siphonaria sp. JEL0065]|nr:hypothetical protein HDU68_003393 [Siphonaria sp. JEL0065]
MDESDWSSEWSAMSQKIIQKKRDTATIAQVKAAKEALKLQRQREKDIKKALQDMKWEEQEAALVAAAKATKTLQFVWNENASLQVVADVDSAQEATEARNMGKDNESSL